MLTGHNIICFALGDWWGMNPNCATHIMKRMSKKNRVLYINPFSSDLLGSINKRKGLLLRIIRKFRSIVQFLKRPEPNLFIYSPFFLPLHGIKAIDLINNFLLRFQLMIICHFLGMSRPIIWVGNIRSADLLGWCKSDLIVYHVSDLFAECKYTANRNLLRRREQKVIERSDLVICVSEKLYRLKLGQCNNVFYLPHGVDIDLFREAAQKNECMKELVGIPKPIAGYFGTMTANNDIELLLYCARNLSDISFVFAGQITGGDYSELLQMPNVYYLGRLPYEKIPFLCAGFDICMLQWKMSNWIKYCNPLKLFEYMSSGKPIVSVPIDEIVEKYSDLVSVANSKEEFCNAIIWELNNDTQVRANRRIEIARENSWDNRIERLSEVISSVLDAKVADYSKKDTI